MKLYKPGTKVKIGEHYSVSATVSAVSIALEMKVLYEVFWWEGAERKEMWINAAEIEQSDSIETIEVKFSLS